jgi:hypothetical protein
MEHGNTIPAGGPVQQNVQKERRQEAEGNRVLMRKEPQQPESKFCLFVFLSDYAFSADPMG